MTIFYRKYGGIERVILAVIVAKKFLIFFDLLNQIWTLRYILRSFLYTIKRKKFRTYPYKYFRYWQQLHQNFVAKDTTSIGVMEPWKWYSFIYKVQMNYLF